MGLLDLLNNDTITLTGDPGNVVTFSAGLYGSLGSKGRSFNPTGEGEPGKNGPILGDRVTFSANANADPSQICSTDVHMIARKSLENREIVQFECASNIDMAGIHAPKRQILPDEFPGIGEFFQ